MSYWFRTTSTDSIARRLADRHYNRQKIGSRRFVPPGRCLVLVTRNYDALWVTSYPYAEYVRHMWAGAWMNSLFRNESKVLSSLLIKEAVLRTIQFYGNPPKHGMVSFIDADKTRRKRDPGRCYRKAGFRHVGFTDGGLWVLQLPPSTMPQVNGLSPLQSSPVWTE